VVDSGPGASATFTATGPEHRVNVAITEDDTPAFGNLAVHYVLGPAS
jgi:hypothetical protein